MAYQNLSIILLLHGCDLNMMEEQMLMFLVGISFWRFHGFPGASNKTQKMDEHGGQFSRLKPMMSTHLDEKWWQIAQKLKTCIAMSLLLRFCSCSPLIFFFSFVLLTLSQATYTYLVAWQDVQRWWYLFTYSWRVSAFCNIQINIHVHLETYDAFRIVSIAPIHMQPLQVVYAEAKKPASWRLMAKGLTRRNGQWTAGLPTTCNIGILFGMEMRCISCFVTFVSMVRPFGGSMEFRCAVVWNQ